MSSEGTKRAHRSRRRGRAGEYRLRDHFRSLGYQADRVPMSGAAQGFKGDVRFKIPGREGELTAELKNWGGTFQKIYDLYFENIRVNKSDLMSFSVDGLCIDMSTSIDSLFDTESVYPPATSVNLFDKYSRTFARFKTLNAMRGGADVFVIKDNHLPFIFIRMR